MEGGLGTFFSPDNLFDLGFEARFFFLMLYLKILILYWAIKLVNNVMLVSGVQKNDSVSHTYIHSFPNSFPI